MTGLHRTIRRQTAFIDYRTGQPAVVELTPSTIRIRAKGHQRGYLIPWSEVWLLGARIRAEELKAEKKAKREERRKAARR